MKKFLLIFISLFAIEMGIYGLEIFFHNPVVSFLYCLVCLPASLIDRSYPFYAMGGGAFQLALLSGNVLIHTILIIGISKIMAQYRKTKSL